MLRSFAGLDRAASDWGSLLASVPRGAILGFQIGNQPEWLELLLACFRRGLIPLPLGQSMRATERALALKTCRASAWVEMEEGRARLTQFPEVPPPEWPGPAPDLLKLTSGTTAAPRAIRFRAGQLAADCRQICRAMGIWETDLNYGAIPFSHAYGFSNLVTPLLCLGVPMVATEDRMPRALLSGLERTGASVFPGMPVFFDKLAALDNPPPLPKLRLCISAGAPLSAWTAECFAAKFGLNIHAFYGSSECGGIAYDSDPSPVYQEGFVGTALHEVQLTPRPDGTILIESPAVGDGYWPEADPALTAGRFVPGDLVRFEPNGIVLTGRISDIINVAGRKLNPREVEAQLLRFPGVRQAVVFGIPSPLRHEQAVACVAGIVSAKELTSFLRSTLSAWQVPKDLWIVEEIPFNERGKVSRKELAAEYLRRARADGYR